MGDLDGDLASFNGLHREAREAEAATVDLHPCVLCAQGFGESDDEGIHLGGHRGEQVEILRGANHQMVGQHGVPARDRKVSRLREVEHDPRYPLVQRVQAHDAAAPSDGPQAARTCGDSHRRGHSLSNASALMNPQTSVSRPSVSTI